MCSLDEKHTGPVGFWCLNDWIELPRIDQQLFEFADKGFSGVVIHPRDGLKTPYLSKSWFDLVEYIVDNARALNIEVWLYDEDPYPSGSAGGKLLELYPNLVGKTLEFTELDVEPVDGLIYKTFEGIKNVLRIYAFSLNSDGSVSDDFQDITRYAGLTGSKWNVRGKIDHSYGPIFGDAKAFPHWRAMVEGENWTLQWPTGDNVKYKILVVSTKNREDTRHGYYVDLLNPETTQRFIELTHQATFDAIGKEKFSEFVAVFTDEAKLCYPYPWTDILPKIYYESYKRDFFADLPHLYLNINEDGYKVRFDYRTLLGKVWKKSFFEPVSKWCSEHDLIFTGHIVPEEDPFCQATYAPELSEMLLEMDWPGSDLITSLIGTPEFQCKLLGQKLVSSIANQGGKERCISECLGVSGEGLTIDRMKKTIDWLAICGIDTFVLHAQFYSLRGDRKREAPPSIFYQAPYWKYFNIFSKYISKLSQVIRNGIPVRPIALLYPTSVFKAMVPVLHENIHLADKGDIEIADKFSCLMGSMMSSAMDFDIVAESFLTKSEIINSKLIVGKAAYDCLVIPDIDMLDEASLEFIKSLIKENIKIFSLTEKVKSIQNQKNETYFKALSMDDLIRNCIDSYSDLLVNDVSSHVYVNTVKSKQGIQKIIWNPTDGETDVSVHQESDITSLDDSIVNHSDKEGSSAQRIKLAPWQMILISENSDQNFENDKECYLGKLSEKPLDGDYILEPTEQNELNLPYWQIISESAASQTLKAPSATEEPMWDYSGQAVKACAKVMIYDKFDELYLCWEDTFLTRSYSFFINNEQIKDEAIISNGYMKKVNVANQLIKGSNTIKIKIKCVPQASPVIADHLKLRGEFLVSQTYSQDNNYIPVIVKSPDKIVLSSNLSWSKAGFPHYSGVMKYTTGFEMTGINKDLKYYVSLPCNNNDVVEVIVNNQPIGVIAWKNACLDITNFIEPGKNKIQFIAANTSINSIEAIPKCSGLKDYPVLSCFKEKIATCNGIPSSHAAISE